MKNTKQTNNNTEDENSISEERQDVAQVRNERSCPPSSGSPLECFRGILKECVDDRQSITAIYAAFYGFLDQNPKHINAMVKELSLLLFQRKLATDEERQDVTCGEERTEFSQSSGSPRFISRDLAQSINDSIDKIRYELNGDFHRKNRGDTFRIACDDETLTEITNILKQLKKYSLPSKFSLNQLDGYSG